MCASCHVCYKKEKLTDPAKNCDLGTTLYFSSSYVRIGKPVILTTCFSTAVQMLLYFVCLTLFILHAKQKLTGAFVFLSPQEWAPVNNGLLYIMLLHTLRGVKGIIGKS